MYNFGRRVYREARDGDIEDAVRMSYEMCLRGLYSLTDHGGVAVVEEEWDTLIVLTACRYDTFAEVNTIPGTLEKRTSQGTSLMEWLIANFPDQYEDIVYVSGNPRISNVEFDQGASVGQFRGADHFHEVVDVSHDAWDKERNTVPPKPVTDAAVEAREEYPDKRLIVHYLQPHAPWIGETSITGADLAIAYDSPSEWFRESGELGPWGEFGLAYKQHSTDHLRGAYRDNLRFVVEEVERLLGELDGRVVVTGDHGEAFGENGIIEHPAEVYIDELVEVPWLVVDSSAGI
jgi:hypothetical protein